MYPSDTRAGTFPPITIVTRAPADETLFPNDGNCRRFAQLSRAFAQRTADRYNGSPDLEYVNNLISKWMPESSKTVAVDSHPRLVKFPEKDVLLLVISRLRTHLIRIHKYLINLILEYPGALKTSLFTPCHTKTEY
jgi:hypothetical protein